MKFWEQRIAQTALRQFFGLAGTSFEPKGKHPTEVINNKKVYQYMSGQFFSLIDREQMSDHETESDKSGDGWLVAIHLGSSW